VPKKIDSKVEDRCVQQVLEHVSEFSSLTAEAVAKCNGLPTESVRHWYVQAQIDGGQRRGRARSWPGLDLTCEELTEVRDLKTKVRRLKDDNDMPRRGRTFFGGHLSSELADRRVHRRVSDGR
jgi:transposase